MAFAVFSLQFSVCSLQLSLVWLCLIPFIPFIPVNSAFVFSYGVSHKHAGAPEKAENSWFNPPAFALLCGFAFFA
jgi:hypothetical protein